MKKPAEDERLDKVRSILGNPRIAIRSIQALAQEHGFDDLAAFNAAFKERFGVSAVNIRKEARNPSGRGRKQ